MSSTNHCDFDAHSVFCSASVSVLPTALISRSSFNLHVSFNSPHLPRALSNPNSILTQYFLITDHIAVLDYVTAYIACLSSDRVDGLYTTVGTLHRWLSIPILILSDGCPFQFLFCSMAVHLNSYSVRWLSIPILILSDGCPFQYSFCPMAVHLNSYSYSTEIRLFIQLSF